jgi:hypothetical protein
VRTQHMRRFGLLALLATVAAGGSGCAHMNNTERGATAGGIMGTAAGAGIGALTGRPLLGAAAGAVTGTAAGALIGNETDKQERREKDAAHAIQLAEAQSAQQRLGITDVIEMSRAGHSDTVIVNQIRSTRSTFTLSSADLNLLKTNGVPDRVIAEMQVARAPGRVVVREQPSTVIYETGPAPVVVRPAPVVVVGPPRPYGYYGGGYYYRRW